MQQVRQGYLQYVYKLFTYKRKQVPTLQQASLFVFVFETRPNEHPELSVTDFPFVGWRIFT